jgi:uncharacterized cupredoxin-like copper-binding protein
VLLLGLSSGYKLGLALSAAVFAGFSLICSMLIPRWRPQFPGKGLPIFLAVCVLLFLGMLAAVETFGEESESAAAGEETTASAPAETTTAPSETTTTPATTGTTTTAAPSATTQAVSETEWAIKLPKTTLSAGTYTFDVKNDGKVPHDLAVEGNGTDKVTATIPPGQSAKLTVALKPGKYDFYCSIPGHKQLGMNEDVTVS